MESVSPAAIPAVATRCHAKRAAAYVAAGRFDLVTAGSPRAASYVTATRLPTHVTTM